MKNKLIKQAKEFGNSSHILLPKNFTNKFYSLEEIEIIGEILTKNEISYLKKLLSKECDKQPSGFSDALWRHALKGYRDDFDGINNEEGIGDIISFISWQGDPKGKEIIKKLKAYLKS